jgi:plastocyanin domain-containing protein
MAARSTARYRAWMVRMSVAVALWLAVSLAACKKSAGNEPAAPTPATAGSVGSDGVRRVAVEAGAKGYQPERIGGKPGEKLVLVFTRTTDSTCLAQLKTPDGTVLDLPKGTPVEIAVTVPQTGEVGFACGMDMIHGAVVAEKS